jgi:fatty acid desaturase
MKKLTLALVVTALVLGAIADTVVEAQDNHRKPYDRFLQENEERPLLRLVAVGAVLLNMILLFALLVIYLDSYRKTKSAFTLGLAFFIGVLFMQRIMFFYFPLLPQFFETLALAILLVLSLE